MITIYLIYIFMIQVLIRDSVKWNLYNKFYSMSRIRNVYSFKLYILYIFRLLSAIIISNTFQRLQLLQSLIIIVLLSLFFTCLM